MMESSKKAQSESGNVPTRKIGYARVSTSDQNPDMQIQALKDYGVPEALIFVDRASGQNRRVSWD